MASTGIMATPLTAEQAAKATATGYDASTYKATGYTGTGYDSSKRTVDPATETVQGQLTGIMSSDSPLLTLSRTSAKQAANASGLLNTSMAAQAGEVAAYQAALPIAQQDATTYSSTSSQNQQLEDAARQYTAGAKNTADQFSASAENTADQVNTGAENTASQFTANAENSTSQLNATEQNKMALQAFDSNTKVALADIEAKYKMQMQSSASASDFYKQVVKNMTDIMASSTMNAAAKQTAINNQVQMLESGLGIIGATGEIPGLTDLLDFSTLPGSGTVANATPVGTGSSQTEYGWKDIVVPAGTNPLFSGWHDSKNAVLDSAYAKYKDSGGGMSPVDWYQAIYKPSQQAANTNNYSSGSAG